MRVVRLIHEIKVEDGDECLYFPIGTQGELNPDLGTIDFFDELDQQWISYISVDASSYIELTHECLYCNEGWIDGAGMVCDKCNGWGMVE